MTATTMDPTFSDALRSVLIDTVSIEGAIRPRKVRRLWIGGGFLAVACLLGGATAVATGLVSLPGSQAVTPLSTLVTQIHTGDATVDLGVAPANTTGISLTLTCLSVGNFSLPGGASETCVASDVGNSSGELSYTLAWSPAERSVNIRTASGNSWQLSAQYVSAVTTPWQVNANGQTYGVANSNGTPDLIAAIATNGRQGFVLSAQLDDADGTTASQHFTTPAQALAWQKARTGETFSIPVYESDGMTVIGTFELGR